MDPGSHLKKKTLFYKNLYGKQFDMACNQRLQPNNFHKLQGTYIHVYILFLVRDSFLLEICDGNNISNKLDAWHTGHLISSAMLSILKICETVTNSGQVGLHSLNQILCCL